MRVVKIPDHIDANGITFKDCTIVVPESPEDEAELEAKFAIDREKDISGRAAKPKRWWQFWL